MSLIKELLEILTPEQQKEIIRDFKEWSGGWSPDEADSTMKKEYIANALPSKFNAKEVEKFLMMESIDIKDLSSGFIKSPKAKKKVKDVTAGKDTVALKNKKEYQSTGKALKHIDIKKGMVVLASYDKYNQGAHIYEILGFTGTDKKYGDGGVKFNSVKEVMDSEGVKTLDELEEKQNENEYGFHTYMVVKDLDDNEEGPWFYLFEGKWSSGSGAEPLSFWLMEEV